MFGPHSQLSWDPLIGYLYLYMVTEIPQVLLSVPYLAKFQKQTPLLEGEKSSILPLKLLLPINLSIFLGVRGGRSNWNYSLKKLMLCWRDEPVKKPNARFLISARIWDYFNFLLQICLHCLMKKKKKECVISLKTIKSFKINKFRSKQLERPTSKSAVKSLRIETWRLCWASD